MTLRSIQARLTLWYTLLIVIVTAGFGAYTYASIDRALYKEMQGMLAQRLMHMRTDVLGDISSYTPLSLKRKIAEVYSPEENERFIRISKPDGTVLYLSGIPHGKAFDPARIPFEQGYASDITERDQRLREDNHLLMVGSIASIDGVSYVLEMGASTKPIVLALHKLVVTLLIGLPVLVVVAAIGGSVLIRRALQPVEDMRATAQQISFSNIRQRLPATETGDAIEHLAQTLNQMLERLDRAYQQASRFSADASHELRTPLTVMRSELENIMQDPHMPVSYCKRLGSILEETEWLSQIVDGLFSIARLDAGEANIKQEIVDLSHLVRSTLEQMQLLADEKKISISVEGVESVPVMGDTVRLQQVIVNLLDNAIKYTMAGGMIALSVSISDSVARLVVRDNGIGIAAEALPHIFERFYRADKAKAEAIPGTGLGLSIVQAICQAHGGSIGVTSVEGSGATFTVELPLYTKV